jgi:hypothetical protein
MEKTMISSPAFGRFSALPIFVNRMNAESPFLSERQREFSLTDAFFFDIWVINLDDELKPSPR